MHDLRKMDLIHNLDSNYVELLGAKDIDARVIKTSSWEDYTVKDVNLLHELLPQIVSKDYFSPDYFIWRNFLYRYLQAHVDFDATNKYTLLIKRKDRRFFQIYNDTSFAAAAAFKALNTDRTPIFENVNMSDVSKVIEVLHMILDDARTLNKYLLNNEVFTKVINIMLESDNQAVHFSAFRVYVLRKRTLGFLDKDLEERILPRLQAWSRSMIESFDLLCSIIGEDNSLFEFYSEPVRNILIRLCQKFEEFLIGRSLFTCRIQEIIQQDLNMCNTLTDKFVRDFVVSTPLYEATTFSPYTMYNLLYYYYKVEDSLLDTYILFAVGDRLFKQAIAKMDDLYHYLTTSHLGEECLNMMRIYLSNMNLERDEYVYYINNYISDLNERGFFTNSEMEGEFYENKRENREY